MLVTAPAIGPVLGGWITDSFNWFVDIVADRRGIARPDALALADGRILTGRQALDDKLIDAIGGQDEAVAWLESDKKITHELPVVDRWPLPSSGWPNVGKWLGSEARAAVGLNADGPVVLDGLVSLWQVGP